jgi:hypothetical protein
MRALRPLGRWAAWVAACALGLLWGAQAQAQAHKSYAVIVAHNRSVDPGTAPLRYADDDGARYWELFSSLTPEAALLTSLDQETEALFPQAAAAARAPTREAVREAFAKARARMRQDKAQGIETTLYAVFVGHGAVDEEGVGYLSLADGRYTREELLRDVVDDQEADQTHLIVDACHAYFMVHARGGPEDEERGGRDYGEALQNFLRQGEERSRRPRLGLLLSTSGAAEVHEWSRYQGGVFSHELRGGLLGAADVDGDLKVSYAELEGYLTAANASVRHARARLNFLIKPPQGGSGAPLLDLRALSSATLLKMPQGQGGRFHVEDSRGVRYADFHAAGDGPTYLALLKSSPRYFVRKEDAEAEVDHEVGVEGFASAPAEAFRPLPAQARGSVEESYREGLFAVPYGRGFLQGFEAARAQAREELPAPSAQRGLEVGLRLGMGAARPVLAEEEGLDGVQPIWELDLALGVTPSLAFELIAQYGTSGHALLLPAEVEGLEPVEASLRLHRPALGWGVRWSEPVWGAWSLESSARGFAQWVIFDGPRRLGDKLSWRGEALGGVRYGWTSQLGVVARGGVGVDVVSRAASSDGSDVEPVWGVGPVGGVALDLRW